MNANRILSVPRGGCVDVWCIERKAVLVDGWSIGAEPGTRFLELVDHGDDLLLYGLCAGENNEERTVWKIAPFWGGQAVPRFSFFLGVFDQTPLFMTPSRG